LLEPRDGLRKRVAASFPVLRLKLRKLQPSPKGCGSNANSLGGFVYVPVSRKRRDRRLLLAPEFLAMAYHLAPPGTIRRRFCE
jgi:hypothetical protein